ncbi:lysylphosphatidylglycerol synthase transmembrane domain-containing protein [Roseovarius arcticus]|uniref:lysylphosphatidylglycerol synthase transmembrane domain-containing protein n=1 Tax=Roseovarius arcticus TaxID=2547404 RepID=UPI001486EC8B|nr:lysylphosphatidylglycerol synthase transmembrane domain-containing protein [Roseovarius arcticus]
MSEDQKNSKKRQLGLSLFGSGLPTASANAKPKSSTHWRTVLRLVAFLALVVCVLSIVDTSQVQSHLAQMSAYTLAVMTALHLVIILLTSWRFARITHAAGAAISLQDANRLTFGATLANMLFPTSLAGDVGRVWLVRRYGLSLKSAVTVGVFDRVIGLASLGSVVLIGTFIAPQLIPLWGVFLLCAMCSGLVVFSLVRWRRGERVLSANGSRPKALVSEAIALSVAAHLVSIGIAFIFLQDQPVSVSIGALFVLFPAVLLAASVPVSVGGWGTRELAAIGAFATVGLGASTAIAMAFMFGVTQTIAAGLGTAFFVLQSRRKEKQYD